MSRKEIDRSTEHVFTSLLISLFLALPITGFLFGLNSCKDCDNGFILNSFNRFLLGIKEAFNTTITLGRPTNDDIDVSNTNIRPFAFFIFICLTLIVYLKLESKKTDHKR